MKILLNGKIQEIEKTASTEDYIEDIENNLVDKTDLLLDGLSKVNTISQIRQVAQELQDR